MSIEQTIPVVDLRDFTHGTDEQRQAFIQALGDALRELGFVAVDGHGVSTELIHENYSLFQELFGLDDETKRKYERPETGRQRGYTSFGVEHAKGQHKADLKEFWHVGRELPAGHALARRMPRNEWPAEVTEFRNRTMALYKAMDDCAQNLLEAISLYLGEAPNALPDMAKDGNSVMRVIHYPVCDGFDDPGTMRAAAHEDINLITLLPEATQSGLEILTRDGRWLEVPSLPGQMIVDTGDMMRRVTNDVIPATTHRVVNPKGTPTDRYSMPFFTHPHPDCQLQVLASCLKDGEEPKYPSMTADEYLKERLRENKVG